MVCQQPWGPDALTLNKDFKEAESKATPAEAEMVETSLAEATVNAEDTRAAEDTKATKETEMEMDAEMKEDQGLQVSMGMPTSQGTGEGLPPSATVCENGRKKRPARHWWATSLEDQTAQPRTRISGTLRARLPRLRLRWRKHPRTRPLKLRKWK